MFGMTHILDLFRNRSRCRRKSDRHVPGGGGRSLTRSALHVEALEDRNLLSFSATAYATGQFPREVAAGDFHGSGFPDLVTADSGAIHLLPNNGDGTFAGPITLAVGSFGELIARDFNGDGNLDLAALTRTSQGLLVETFLGNGDGSFQAPRFSFVGSASLIPAKMVAGDFDGHGNLDLALVANDETVGHFQGLVTVLRGNGDGTFQVTDTHQVAGPFTIVTGLVAADFNGDGIPDLVETNRDGTVNVLLGNGDSTFQGPVAFQPGVFAGSVAAADLRGNGITDLILTSVDPRDPAVSVLLGNGDGTFQAAVRTGVVTGAGSVLAGDFNGDGIPDLAVISAGNSVSVLQGNGDGTFQNPVSYLAGDTPVSLVAADFNGDGALDLATANFRSNDVTVLLNQPAVPVPAAPITAAVDTLFADLALQGVSNAVAIQPSALAAALAAFSANGPDLAGTAQELDAVLFDGSALSHPRTEGRAPATDAAGLADPLPADLPALV
jgi:hypothetical protein